MSRFACLLARGLTPVRDATSGFFLIRRDLARGVTISAGGFKICLELLVRGRAGVGRRSAVRVRRPHGRGEQDEREGGDWAILQQLRDLRALHASAPAAQSAPSAHLGRRARVTVASGRRRELTAVARPDVSTVRAPKIVRDSTCQTIACLVSASRATSPSVARDVRRAQEEAPLGAVDRLHHDPLVEAVAAQQVVPSTPSATSRFLRLQQPVAHALLVERGARIGHGRIEVGEVRDRARSRSRVVWSIVCERLARDSRR